MISPPDIIWILTTQWCASATGYNHDQNARTPWLDGLASESVNYEQAVTPHPSGPQARAALYTGRVSPESGVSDYWDPLPPDARTIAHVLRDRGYVSAFFGKWHLSARDKNAPFVGDSHAKTIVPIQNRGGFDLWEGFESGFLLNDPWLHGTRLSKPRRFTGYQSDIIGQRAVEWIKTAHSGPRFCVISVEAPHPPYHAPAAQVSEQSPDSVVLRSNVPLGGEIESRARSELAGYYSHIEATDRSIGSLISELDLANTILVFTSVHGDMHGSHGVFRKGWPYEESIRVPLLIRNPRQQLLQRRDTSPVSLHDLPHMTVAWSELSEWRCKRDVAPISLPTAPPIPLQCDRPWRGFRSPNQKLILNGDGSPWLYFDLKRDPLEMENLVDNPKYTLEIERARGLI
ncbi:MAG TPA: sulfatase-like hydrolase/transferase [Lacunisphaera sp.]|jgi:arylsulfatase A-like enzyme